MNGTTPSSSHSTRTYRAEVAFDTHPTVYRAEDHEELSQRSVDARARLQRRTVTATGLAAIALAATPWDSPGPREPLPKPGPSKEKRAQRKRQKAARKAARR